MTTHKQNKKEMKITIIFLILFLLSINSVFACKDKSDYYNFDGTFNESICNDKSPSDELKEFFTEPMFYYSCGYTCAGNRISCEGFNFMTGIILIFLSLVIIAFVFGIIKYHSLKQTKVKQNRRKRKWEA